MKPQSFDEMWHAQDRHWWHRSRRDVLADTLADMRLPRTAQILELGAGTGGNLQLLAGFGKLTAVEASPHAIALMQRIAHPGLEIFCGELPDRLPDIGKFDLVCLLDVLEHLDAEHDSLVAARRLLSPHGRLLVTVPAYQWLWSRHDEQLLHRRRYTRSRLHQALTAAGFETTRMTHFFTAVFPLALAARLADRVGTDREVAGSAVPASWLNESLYSLMQFERRLLRRWSLPFGLSILAEARVAAPRQ